VLGSLIPRHHGVFHKAWEQGLVLGYPPYQLTQLWEVVSGRLLPEWRDRNAPDVQLVKLQYMCAGVVCGACVCVVCGACVCVACVRCVGVVCALCVRVCCMWCVCTCVCAYMVCVVCVHVCGEVLTLVLLEGQGIPLHMLSSFSPLSKGT